MKRSTIAVAVAAAMILTAGTAAAQKGQGPKGPKTKSTQSAPKATGGGATKVHASGAQGPKVKSTTTTTTSKAHGPKTTTSKTHGKPVDTTVATTKGKGTDHGAKKTNTTTTTATPTATSTPTTGVTTLALSPVQQKLEKNTNLANKLKTRLGGADVIAAAEGFPTLGSFVSAVNVSSNLGLTFTELKSRILDDGMSLGQAIKAERNDVDVTSAVTRAETDAKVLIAESESTTTTKKTKAPKAPKTTKRDGQ